MPVSSFINLSNAEKSELKRLVSAVLHGATIDKSLQLPDQAKYPTLFLPAACFVTLYSDHKLRGCIGTYHAQMALWFNVCRYSYCSAFEDRRFTPLSSNELNDIRFEIAILSELTALPNRGEKALLEMLNTGTDGLLIKDPVHSALFLPSVWQALPTPVAFLHALKQKGGWSSDYWDLDIEIYRFSTSVIAGKMT